MSFFSLHAPYPVHCLTGFSCGCDCEGCATTLFLSWMFVQLLLSSILFLAYLVRTIWLDGTPISLGQTFGNNLVDGNVHRRAISKRFADG